MSSWLLRFTELCSALDRPVEHDRSIPGERSESTRSAANHQRSTRGRACKHAVRSVAEASEPDRVAAGRQQFCGGSRDTGRLACAHFRRGRERRRPRPRVRTQVRSLHTGCWSLRR